MNARECIVFAAAATSLANGSLDAQRPPRDFLMEYQHSYVAFEIGFMGFPVRGRFNEPRATIAYVDGDLEKSSVSVAIVAKTINTGGQTRDDHLRSSDFFDVEKFPYITFQSTSIKRSGDGYVMTGPLTMHGVTKVISIPFRAAAAPIEEPQGATLITFSGRTRLSRLDFGIVGGSKFNSWFDQVRSATMADSVDVILDVQGWDPDYTRDKRYDRTLARMDSLGVDSVISTWRTRVASDSNFRRGAEWDLSQIGRVLSERGKGREAEKVLRFTLELYPQSMRVHAALARALERAGRRSEALGVARRALEVDAADTAAKELVRRLQSG
jgi:polyisoprenoid-binding protein YceI